MNILVDDGESKRTIKWKSEFNEESVKPLDESYDYIDLLREKITDTARLDWMIENREYVMGGELHGYWLAKKHTDPKCSFKTPREAIDAAMKESQG